MFKPEPKQIASRSAHKSEQAFPNEVSFIPEHSMPGGNLLLEIWHLTILQPQHYFSDVQYPQSQFTETGNREHHNCPLTSRQLPDEASWVPGTIHTSLHHSLGLPSFETTLLSTINPSKSLNWWVWTFKSRDGAVSTGEYLHSTLPTSFD